MKELTVMYRAFGASVVLGRLADAGGEVLFQYSSAAIALGLELSPIRLPLRVAAYPDQQQHYMNLQRVPGLVSDSLPDSWGFGLMNRRMKALGIDLSTVSTLDRLAYLGENTMGALTYVPCTDKATDGADLSLLALANEVQALLIDNSHAVLAEMARAGGSPGGARPKALVYLDPVSGQMSTRAGSVAGAESWLIKFPASDDASDACALEALYAQVADLSEMGMTATRFFDIGTGLTAFGTRRFDREGGQRVHVHSLAGLLHANFQIPSVSYDDFFRATRRLTRDQRALKKAVQRCVFNVLMNNRDDHAKNIAFLLDRDRQWRLAPPFDLTFCPGYRGEHFMDIAGEGKAPTRAHIVVAAQGAGLAAKDTETIIDAVLARITDKVFRTLAKELPVRAATVNAVANMIEENRKRLTGG
ncbi:type II toxin-antitoxin system HipA family toxin [Actimicrobium sp. CCC2.4]|uniref:type II toxin-antitoxin system HipA family toxin n=1 Tax=Actimicrobium sp. CCC2.4 TaxID=3048606 RepID=UPI002AC8D41C|nr:type II toxin-antitoxin system HipA family toxin [Actimicrobium sp. CCC2.4]MEB0136937.1 type II toxin-antitoxin system HipA family toxin [Actimicrobium sp. CCC2.4]WPX32711.1 type II toxin-antitoxin system HipA family toxin [Actimicrobium sp. CCC2.4]